MLYYAKNPILLTVANYVMNDGPLKPHENWGHLRRVKMSLAFSTGVYFGDKEL